MLRRAEHDGPGDGARWGAPAPGRAVTRTRAGRIDGSTSSVRKCSGAPALGALRTDLPPYLRWSVRPGWPGGGARGEPPPPPTPPVFGPCPAISPRPSPASPTPPPSSSAAGPTIPPPPSGGSVPRPAPPPPPPPPGP